MKVALLLLVAGLLAVALFDNVILSLIGGGLCTAALYLARADGARSGGES